MLTQEKTEAIIWKLMEAIELLGRFDDNRTGVENRLSECRDILKKGNEKEKKDES
jgi:hypothetical protein